ncbi:MAG: acetyltransferase [Proteobacteria bacterium]|nr:acetyltransferase [Pseudomonadota bacterium]
MRIFDVFNGDADGICALHQLRLAEPAEAELVTGVKRDIGLLARVPAEKGDRVTVLDVSLDRNRAALLEMLERGVQLRYFDHHYAGEIPRHPLLEAHIDTARGVCTSLLVDRYLGGRFRAWAVVAAFGDNLDRSARELATGLGLPQTDLENLRVLGQGLNYNAYGETEADLVMPPAALYRTLDRYPNPLQFIEREPVCARLDAARRADMAAARAVPARWSEGSAVMHELPDAPWARRVGGSYANALAAEAPGKAVAMLVPGSAGGYVVSVRSPAGTAVGADDLCRGFPGGGGRRDAGGIDRLPESALEDFRRRFAEAFA